MIPVLSNYLETRWQASISGRHLRAPIVGQSIGKSQDLVGAPHHRRIDHLTIQRERRKSTRGGIVFRSDHIAGPHEFLCAWRESLIEYGDLCRMDRQSSGKAKTPRMRRSLTKFMRVGKLADASYEAKREQSSRAGGKQDRKIRR